MKVEALELRKEDDENENENEEEAAIAFFVIGREVGLMEVMRPPLSP